MKINLWILYDWLKEYQPEISCSSSVMNIEKIRFFDSDSTMHRNTLYIGTSDMFFRDGSPLVVCKDQEDYIRLNTDNMTLILNESLEALNYYQNWYLKNKDMIHEGCTLNDLLESAALLFHTTLSIVDTSQFLIAYSSNTPEYMEDPFWEETLTKRSAPMDLLKQFNQAHQESFSRKSIGYVDDAIFPKGHYYKNIFIDDQRAATVILLETPDRGSVGYLSLFDIFCEQIKSWILLNQETDSSYKSTSYFARSLDDSPGSKDGLIRKLNLLGWSELCTKQIFIAKVISGGFHFDAYLSRRMTNEYEGIYAIPYHEKIVILCNMDMVSYEEFSKHLCDIMKLNHYYGASSFLFTDMSDLTEAYHQADIALKSGNPVSGLLYSCSDTAMNYISNLVETASSVSLIHPVLQSIQDYDEMHNTEYYNTLFCYLKNERKSNETASELFIHRNTLQLRLNRAQSLWNLNLDDPTQRFYLLYSFYHVQYTRL